MEMDNRFIYTSIVSKDSFLKYKEKNYSKIRDVIDLGENYLVKVEDNETRTMLDNWTKSHNINISISSVVTGYARN